jgi:hypothetical protein
MVPAARFAWFWCFAPVAFCTLLVGSGLDLPPAPAQAEEAAASTKAITKAAATKAAGEVDYLHDVKPIFHERCFACHGALKQEGSLRLDTAASMKAGGYSGAAITPSDVAASLLIERIRATEEYERMPPEGKPLTAEQIATITAWVAAGAKAPVDELPQADPNRHWAFQPPVKAALSKMAESEVPANPIDALLEIERARHDLQPVGSVEKSLLLRRVYLDLIGLPPTRVQMHAFLADQQPGAYERVVDELLASPQYGERWGRHFMDIWRYSDWFGLGAQVRNSQKHIWHWRDWIIESLNADKGYDQMVTEMLAADELYPTDRDKLRATGFLARNYYLFNRTTWLDETVEHTSKAFLGLTLNCTKCHDHKYDPITHQEYYQMRAIFEPHQIRLDPLPGETDLEKDGFPRAFDAHLDEVTYLHIRGDDKNPDKSKPIPPGVPAILGTEGFEVTPVALPQLAYRPVLQPFVLADRLNAVEAELAAAQAALDAAQTQLAVAEKAAAEKTAALAAAEKRKANEPAGADDLLAAEGLLDSGKLLWEDDFTAAHADRWQQGEGAWTYAAGQAVQAKVGAVRAFLRSQQPHPANFEAKLKFKITGGQQWKSVGICFDVAEGREKMIYMSAVAGGSKLQIAYKPGADYVYPPQGALARTVELNVAYELGIKVRDRLVNVAIDGEQVLAFELPIAREPGQLDLVTFDAAAEFDHFELRELAESAKLVGVGPGAEAGDDPAGEAAGASVPVAKLTVRAAELAIAAIELKTAAVRAGYAADVAKANGAAAEEIKPLVATAAVAARQQEVAQARQAVAAAELKQALANSKTLAAAEKELATAKANLTKAEQALKAPGENYPVLHVSKKAPEGPDESTASQNAPYPAASTGRRTALAHWLMRKDHPLTARVAVNHIWLRHFGQPLVETMDDFGLRAPRPAQQPLLDWLAVDLIEHQWSMKYLHRLMVTSQAYRLSTSSLGADAATAAADPDNNFYWRRRPVRLESQALRDSVMHLAGELELKLGGPTIDPKQELEVPRRSVYFTHSRDNRASFLSMFDDADIFACYRRTESIVPQQALTLANSKLSLLMARKITQKLQAELGEVDDETFLLAAYELVLANRPDAVEKAACLEMLAITREHLKELKATEIESRARHDLVHALLNHNDFLTIR